MDFLNLKNPPIANLYIKSAFKNTILTLTDSENKPLRQWSTKSLKKIDTKKNSPYNIQRISHSMINFAQKKKIKVLKLYINGKGMGRYNVVKHLKRKFKIFYIEDITPVPFNGCRSKKKKKTLNLDG